MNALKWKFSWTDYRINYIYFSSLGLKLSMAYSKRFILHNLKIIEISAYFKFINKKNNLLGVILMVIIRIFMKE